VRKKSYGLPGKNPSLSSDMSFVGQIIFGIRASDTDRIDVKSVKE